VYPDAVCSGCLSSVFFLKCAAVSFSFDLVGSTTVSADSLVDVLKVHQTAHAATKGVVQSLYVNVFDHGDPKLWGIHSFYVSVTEIGLVPDVFGWAMTRQNDGKVVRFVHPSQVDRMTMVCKLHNV
jgi:hypothetical protein